MIGKLSGRVDYITTDHTMIDVRGVGYIVFCSDRTLRALPRVGEPVSLFTDLLVREDLMQLFGFTSLVEKEWHRLLMSVQGIGAKAALAILGALGPDGVSRAIALGDWAALKAAKGVGPKTAKRVVIELKDKAPAVMSMSAGSVPVATPDDAVVDLDAPIPVAAAALDTSVQADALSALTNLGYSPGDAAGAVAQVLGDAPDAGASDVIKMALKLLAPKG